MEDRFGTYTKLYNTYADALFAYGRSLGFPPNMCMDAIHDLFVRMIESNRDPDRIGNIRFYLLRSLKNRLLDMDKHDRRTSPSPIGEFFQADVSALEGMIADEEMQQLVARVARLLAALTANQREAVYLRYMQDMEYEQIGSLLGINADSARKLVFRAAEKLRHSDLGPLGTGLFMLMVRSLH